MKKILALTSVLALAACWQNAKYQETGLVCEDAAHNQITLDVKATDTNANVVVNGEKIALAVEPVAEGADVNMATYVGTNANNEKVKLNIVLATEGQDVKYMLGVNTDETTYVCTKKVEEAVEEKPTEEAAK